MTNSQHAYEVRPRKDKRGFDLISDALPFGRLWYTEISHAIIAVLLIAASAQPSLIAAPPNIAWPHAIYAPKPEYPSQARDQGIKGDGVFILRVRIQTGVVKDVLVARSTGSRILDSAAIRALKQWHSNPARHICRRLRCNYLS
jgi:TonB family protein